MHALCAARDAGIQLGGDEALKNGLAWFEEVTDPATGRTGYNSIGSCSSRTPGINDQYPTDKSEALTALALTSRFLVGQRPPKVPLMFKGADLFRRNLPEWDSGGLYNDLYYWYFASHAMCWFSKPYGDAWSKSLRHALLSSQRKDDDAKGSWDPKDAWGWVGGRIYTTALAAMCLEAPYRFDPAEFANAKK